MSEIVAETTPKVAYAWTEAGPCKILTKDEARVKVLLPFRKNPIWISQTQILPPPKEVRLFKRVSFDMKCGCIALADLTEDIMKCYNIYGSLKKYSQVEVVEPSASSPYKRRKELATQGFTKARGKEMKVEDLNKDVYRLMKQGYKIHKA